MQKEKVKVYIDEKYHHATDPSIRPKDKDGQPLGGAQEAVSPSSKASTLVRKESTSEEKKAEDTYGKDIKDIPRSTWKLLTNKIYLVTCLGACMELIIVSGFIVFLPKYLETQFNLSKSMASMFTGGIAIPGTYSKKYCVVFCRTDIKNIMSFITIFSFQALVSASFLADTFSRDFN